MMETFAKWCDHEGKDAVIMLWKQDFSIGIIKIKQCSLGSVLVLLRHSGISISASISSKKTLSLCIC